MDPMGQNPEFPLDTIPGPMFSQEMAPEWSWKEAAKQQAQLEYSKESHVKRPRPKMSGVDRNSKQIMWQINAN